MVSRYFDQLCFPLSSERLERYRTLPTTNDLDTITNYLWNIALSEALYPTLHGLEIALRNAIQTAATDIHGTAYWFDQPIAINPKGSPDSRQRDFVRAARGKVAKRKVQVTAGRIVAELNFGFWTTMLSGPYEQGLWTPSGLRALDLAFPHVPRSYRSRKKIHGRCDSIRRGLRNPTFHFEPIWDRQNLDQQHNNVLDTIGWMSPTFRDTIERHDRFPDVYLNGRLRIHADLANHINHL